MISNLKLLKLLARFVFTATLLITLTTLTTLFPSDLTMHYLDLMHIPFSSRIIILYFAFVNILLSFFAESFLWPVLLKGVSRLRLWLQQHLYMSWKFQIDPELQQQQQPLLPSNSLHYKLEALKRKWRAKGKLYKIYQLEL